MTLKVAARSEKAVRITLHRTWMRGWNENTSATVPHFAMNHVAAKLKTALETLQENPNVYENLLTEFFEDGIRCATEWQENEIWVKIN